jgi:hypothetical protein
MRHLVHIDVQSMQVKNVYSHLHDYTGANFEGAIGLSKLQIDQLGMVQKRAIAP